MPQSLQGRTFHERLRAASERVDSALCVGLDPRRERLPKRLRGASAPLFEFCRTIVDATAELVCAFKPQFACFAAGGAEHELRLLMRHLREEHPDIPVILDAKRNDIGATAELYAEEAFAAYGADAVTVNPYLGWDAIAPFAAWPERGVVVLCHTSNPDSAWLQEQPPENPAYLRVAELVAGKDAGNMALVVGATFPAQMTAVRERAPRLPFLVPGIGAQGGDAAAVFLHGMDARRGGLVVNASRSILFASQGDDWRNAAQRAAQSLRDDLRQARDAAATARSRKASKPSPTV